MDDQVRNLIVEENLPLVRRLAGSYARRFPAVSRDDLFQAGALALVRAASRYDPERGSFCCFARKHIRGAIIDEVRRALGVVLAEGDPPDTKPKPDEIVALRQRQRIVARALHGLPARQASLIRKRMKGARQRECGATQQAAQRMEQRALRNLRRALERIAA